MATSSASIVHTSANASSSSPLSQHGVAFSAPIGPPSPSSAQPVAPTASTTQSTGTTAANNNLPTTNGPTVEVQVGYVGASSIPNQSPTGATAYGHGRPSHSHFFRTASFGNVLGAVVLVLTVTGLGWTFGVGAVGLDLQKWTARNDALQACLSWESTGLYSRYCNETIKAGVTRPPLAKRTRMPIASWPSAVHSTTSAYQLALLITIMLFIGVFTLLYFRPRMHLFRPHICNVRTYEPQAIPVWRTIAGYIPYAMRKSSKEMEDLLRSDLVMCWLNSSNPGHIDEATGDLGRRIGVLYESDSNDSDGDYEHDESHKYTSGSSSSSSTLLEHWSVGPEDSQSALAGSVTARKLQELHACLMDWFLKQDPGDVDISFQQDSEVKSSLMEGFKMDELLSIAGQRCHELGALPPVSEQHKESRAQDGQTHRVPPVTWSEGTLSYIWAMIRELERRLPSEDNVASPPRITCEQVYDPEWNTLLSRWHECIDSLKELKMRYAEAISEEHRSPQYHLHELCALVYRPLVDLCSTINHAETAQYEEKPPELRQDRDLRYDLKCAQDVQDRATQALLSLEKEKPIVKRARRTPPSLAAIFKPFRRAGQSSVRKVRSADSLYSDDTYLDDNDKK